MSECRADFETRSDVDLKIRGAGPYFASPHWRALILAYSIDDGPIQTWTDGPCPHDLRRHIESGGWIKAFNASFERHCFEEMAKRCDWPRPADDRYRCSMATASALGLPRSLDKLGEALGLKVRKDKRGAALIRMFSVPAKHEPLTFREPADHPKEFAEFVAYCKQDVETEAEADRRMVPLSDDEQAIYTLSETINRRGIRIDAASARAALRLIDKEKARLDAAMAEITGGVVTACSQAARLTAWLTGQGVRLDGVAKDDILEAFELDDLPEQARRALEIRQEASKSSTAKLTAFLRRMDADERVRGCYVYHGAAPGRWSSAGGINFANLPRPRAVFDDAELDPATLFAAFRAEEPDLLRTLYGAELSKPTHLVSDAMRGFLIAAPGKDFIAVDYSGIQGAIGAWLAGEDWKLQAMRDIIADPTLPDLYRRAAAGILGTTTAVITKKHHMRQAVGKTSELALLFGGSIAALVGMAANYGMRRRDLHALYSALWAAAGEEAREKAVKRYEQRLKSRDRQKTDILTREAWIACKIVVDGWRRQNPASVEAWSALEAAMREAMREPGRVVRALGRIGYLAKSGFLWCRLPSGRCIAYASPKMKDQVWAKLRLSDGSWSEAEVIEREEAMRLEARGEAQIQGATTPKVTALGVDSTTQKMTRYALYGGLTMENCLAAGTSVLTLDGWKSIEDINLSDSVWDGSKWVHHKGMICKGVQDTMDFGGVVMTPDHKVWVGNGWSRAENADIHAATSASQNAQPDWRKIRSSYCHRICWWGRKKELVARTLRLWGRAVSDWRRTPQRQYAELWLLSDRIYPRTRQNTRYVETPSILGLAQHDRSVPPTDKSRIQKLRWPWYKSMRTLGKIRKFLGRYWAELVEWPIARTNQQRSWLLARELHMGESNCSVSQPALKPIHRYTKRTNAFLRSNRNFWPLSWLSSWKNKHWMASETFVRPPEFSRRFKSVVYDIVEAGPRHRFTVRGRSGLTFIVSNCCLGIERDILVNGMRHCEAAGYPITLHNYDESVAEVERGFGSVEEMERLMLDLPGWAAGLPLTGHGFRAKRYAKR